MALPANLLSAADRQQVRDALWGLGRDERLSIGQRPIRRRRIFAVTDNSRAFNWFLDRAFDKYREEQPSADIGGFFQWLITYIAEHPEVIIKIIELVLKFI